MEHCLYFLQGDMVIDIRDIYPAIPCKDHVPSPEDILLIRNTLEEISMISVPRYMYTIFPGRVVNESYIEIYGTLFNTGKVIASLMKNADCFCIFVITAGEEFEKYQSKVFKENNPVKDSIVELIGDIILKNCLNRITEELEDDPGLPYTFPYLLGTQDWDLTDQPRLFAFFPSHPCGVTLMENGSISPVKSKSGIIGIGEKIPLG